MAKRKSLLLTTLALALALVSGMILVACNGDGTTKEKHAVTWNYDANGVTVTAEGYDELPTELEEGATLTFKVEAKEGYELGLVTGAKKSGDNYTLTMAKADLTVRITSSKILNDITVAVDGSLVFYEDQEVDRSKLTVTANYALGDEVLKADDYTIVYPKGTAFEIGDENFKVSFGGIEKEIALDKPVEGRQNFTSAKLILENNIPYLVVSGFYLGSGDAKTEVASYINNCTMRGPWTGVEYTVDVTVNEDKSFELKLGIPGAEAGEYGNHYYFHTRLGADGQDLTAPLENETCKPGKDNSSLTATYIGEPLVADDGTEFYVGICEDWGSKAIMIVVVNEKIRSNGSVSFKEAAWEVDNVENPTKIWLVLTAEVANFSEAELKTVSFCEQADGAPKEGMNLVVEKVEFDAATGEAKFYFNFTDVEPNGEWWWGHWTINGQYRGDVNCTVKEETIVVNGKEYKLQTQYNMPIPVVTPAAEE